ncbi:MAG: hypothetical protein RQ866_05020 [Bacteroidales bacterium]|nr:hypothetical protein [Bacteroidales bacterium]
MKRIISILLIFAAMSLVAQNPAEQPIDNSIRIYGHARAQHYMKAPVGIFDTLWTGGVGFVIDTVNNYVEVIGGGFVIKDATSQFKINGVDLLGGKYVPEVYGADNEGNNDVTDILNVRCPGGSCNYIYYFNSGTYLIEGDWLLPDSSGIDIAGDVYFDGSGSITGNGTVIFGSPKFDTTMQILGTWNVPEWKPTWFLGGTLTGPQPPAVDSIMQVLNADTIQNWANIDFKGTILQDGSPIGSGSFSAPAADSLYNQVLVRNPATGAYGYDTILLNRGLTPLIGNVNLFTFPDSVKGRPLRLGIGFGDEDLGTIWANIGSGSLGVKPFGPITNGSGTAMTIQQGAIDFDYNPGAYNDHIWLYSNSTGWFQTRGTGAAPHGMALGGDNWTNSFKQGYGGFGDHCIVMGTGNYSNTDGWLGNAFGFFNGRGGGTNNDTLWVNRMNIFGNGNLHTFYNNKGVQSPGETTNNIYLEDVFAFGNYNGSGLADSSHRILMIGNGIFMGNTSDTASLEPHLKDITVIGMRTNDGGSGLIDETEYEGSTFDMPNALILMGDADSSYTYGKYNGDKFFVGTDSVLTWSPWKYIPSSLPGFGLFPNLISLRGYNNGDPNAVSIGYDRYGIEPTMNTTALNVKYGQTIDSGGLTINVGSINIKTPSAIQDVDMIKNQGFNILGFFGGQSNNTGFYLGTKNKGNSFTLGSRNTDVGSTFVGSENASYIEGAEVYTYGRGNLRSGNGNIGKRILASTVHIHGNNNISQPDTSQSLDDTLAIYNSHIHGSFNGYFLPDSMRFINIYGSDFFSQPDSLWSINHKGLKYQSYFGRPYRGIDGTLSMIESEGWMVLNASPDSTNSDFDIYTDKISLKGDALYKGGTEVERGGTISDNDATPDVSGGNVWIYAGSANSVTITDLDNPQPGAFYTIKGNSDTYTLSIDDTGNFNLAASVALGLDDVIVLYCVADNDYIEISRTDN